MKKYFILVLPVILIACTKGPKNEQVMEDAVKSHNLLLEQFDFSISDRQIVKEIKAQPQTLGFNGTCFEITYNLVAKAKEDLVIMDKENPYRNASYTSGGFLDRRTYQIALARTPASIDAEIEALKTTLSRKTKNVKCIREAYLGVGCSVYQTRPYTQEEVAAESSLRMQALQKDYAKKIKKGETISSK